MTTQEAEVVLKVNSKQAQERLQSLQEQAKTLRARFAEAFSRGDTRAINEINKKLQQTNKEITNLRTNAVNIRAAMVRLDEASPRELRRTIAMINNEINSGRVKRGSKEWDSYIAKLKEVQGELAKVKAEMEADDDSGILDRIKSGLGDWGAVAAGAIGAMAGVALSGRTAIETYAAMQAEEANVIKYTGMTADEVARLNEEFRKLDTRTSREDLNRLAQEAGRLGKTSVEDVLGFVKAADQINVALDDLGDGATLTLSKLTGIFGEEARWGTEQSLLKVGSVINELSQNCSASAPYLAEFSSRLGGIAAQSKMTIAQVMSMAAILDTQNLAVEASSTAVGQLITKIYQEPAKIARAAGLDVKKFSATVKNDMNGALIMLFERLNKFGGMENLAKIFDDMGTDGARAIPVLAALSGHIEELKWQQQEATEAFRKGTSVTEEFGVQNTTVQAELDKSRKEFTELAVTLGEQLLPVMTRCIDGTRLFMQVITAIVKFIIEYKRELLTVAASVTAYTVAVKWNTIAIAANNTITAIGTRIKTAWRVITLGCSVAYNTLTGNIVRANAAQKLFNATLAVNPIGAVLTAITTLLGALWAYGVRAKEATEKQRRLRQETEAFNKSISDYSEASAKYAQEEKTKLDMLYRAATDEASAKKERLRAAKDLIAIYPETFKNYSAEEIMLGKAKIAYDNLTTAIIENARARAAAELVFKNQQEVITLETQIREAESELLNFAETYHATKAVADNTPDATSPLQTGQHTRYVNAQNALSDAETALDAQQRKVDELYEKRDKINIATEDLINTIGASNIAKFASSATTADTTAVTQPESDSEKKKREKAEREAARKARENLKRELDERKALYQQAEAENLTAYVTGVKDYSAYCQERERLEAEYADAVIDIHKKHNKIDIAAYGSALKSKATLLKKQQDDERKRTLRDVEVDHAATNDRLVSSFYDTSSPDFQNQRHLNQRLFEEEVRYLQEKRDLFLEGSEERAAIEQRIEERIAADRLDKQKETAQAMMNFEAEYRKGSGSRREKMELDIIESLHKQGMISEEEYQRAILKIKEKYRDEDAEKARKVQSEYGDMMINLYRSFSKLFSEMGSEGSDFWANLSEAGTAAFAVMAAGLQQYSAYANAERDLELARIEQRYDKEISAAGKNEKKKASLEKQKEAEVAKVKKKYNDRAMKIEIAQAVAQTALAAISAYASASKVNWLLGPIAAAMATAAGAIQIATIKKQHEAEAAGYYSGGFTARDADDRKEVGVVHANEFVANHQAVANPALAPVLRLIDHAQRNNTIGSLTSADVSRAIGSSPGVGAGGGRSTNSTAESVAGSLTLISGVAADTRAALDRLTDTLEGGIEATMIMDGERGFHKKYENFKKLLNTPRR